MVISTLLPEPQCLATQGLVPEPTAGVGWCSPTFPAAAGPCCWLPAGALLGSLLAPTCPSQQRKPVCRGKVRGSSVGVPGPLSMSQVGQLPGPGPPSTSGF